MDWFRKKPPKASDTAHVLSFLTPAECSAVGLPGVAVQGTFTDEECSLEGFRPNPAFVEFMHEVIRKAGPADPEIQEAAEAQKDGWVYVIDLRTPDGPQGKVPPEDIIGAFEVKEGRILPDSYRPNTRHRVLTNHGPVQLPPSLQSVLTQTVLEQVSQQDPKRGKD